MSELGLARAAPGVVTPGYDRHALSVGIVHFGVGGFHRSHQARYVDDLLQLGDASEWAICGVGLLPGDAAMRDALVAQDGLYTLITKDEVAGEQARIIGSIIEFLHAPDDPAAVIERLSDPAVRIVSLTITAAGYALAADGSFDPTSPGIADDLAAPTQPRTVFGLVIAALRRRRATGIPPFTVMSCDNFPGNGDVAKRTFTGFAAATDPELASWMEAEVCFPNSMVDRITPVTVDDDRALANQLTGLHDLWPVVCEPFTQWVLEDDFSGGRPPFELAGVQLVKDAAPYELLKVRLLNSTHQAMSFLGYLAEYRYVHELCADPTFVGFLRRYLIDEVAPNLPPVPGVDVDAYIDTLFVRFANRRIADTLVRLSSRPSVAIPTLLVPIIVDGLSAGTPIDCCAAIVAAWARFALGVDERGDQILHAESIDRDSALAAATTGDPVQFLLGVPALAALGDEPRFVLALRTAYRALQDEGAASLVRSLSGTTAP